LNVDLQRAVDRWLGVPLCALASLVLRLRPRRAPPSDVRTIVVILLSEMGSLVLAQPMFQRLAARYPGATIHVMLFGRNGDVLGVAAPAIARNVIAIDDSSLLPFARSMLSAIRTVRRLRPDVAIDCELFARASALLSWLSGAPVRVGFHRHTQEGLYRGSIVNRPVLYNPYRHLSQQLLTLARAIESTTHPPDKDACDEPLAAPRPAFAPGEVEMFNARLDADFPRLAGRRIALVYASGGILPIRAWPLEHWKALVPELIADGYTVAIVGLPADKPVGAALSQAVSHPDCVDLSGYTRSVRELIVLLDRAALLVTNDGGPAQFSSLTGVPTVALFGPETPALYGPLGAHASGVSLGLPCSPCLTAYNHRRSPCDGDNQCLKRIPPARVLAEARAVVARAPSRERGALA
jgi:ADP-heptose:LPS heptosyltransferase